MGVIDRRFEILGLVSVWGSTIIRSNGIRTVFHQKNPSNDVEHIIHMQIILAKIMEMYTKDETM